MLPALSFRASSPPGPKLLLLDFFSVFETADLRCRIKLRSTDAFSLSYSTSFDEVTWAIDCRDLVRLGLELGDSMFGFAMLPII